MQDTQYQASEKPEPHAADQLALAERARQQAYDRESDAIDLKWLLDTAYTGRHLIVGAVGIAAMLAMAYLTVATPRYEATSQLLIESRRPRLIGGDEVAPGLDTGRFMIGQVIDSQIELLRSPSLAERVIRELDLREFKRRSGGGLLRRFVGGGTTAPGLELDPKLAIPETEKIERKVSQSEVNAFLRGLDVRRVGLSLIIQVRYFHKDPAQAARIANAVATRYLAMEQEKRFRKTEVARKWLTVRVKELQSKIGDARQKIELYKSEHDLVDTGGQPLQERELSESMVQWIAARTNASTLLAEVRKMEEAVVSNSSLEATSLAVNSNVIADYKRQYAQVQRRLAQTMSSFGTTHPQVSGFRAELANIEREITREVKRLIANLRNKHEVSNTKASLLEQRVDQLKSNLSSSRQLKIELAEMERSLKVDSDLYATLLSRLRQTELQRSLKQADATLVRFARPPQRPTRPRKMIVMLGSVMAALSLSAAYMLFTEFFGNFLRTPAAVRRYLGFRNIIPLPFVRSNSGRANGESFATRILKSPASTYVQQIFVLKEQINSTRATDEPLVISVVSAARNEGKSTVSLSFAHYMAESAQRTLLIDCDLHDRSVTKAVAADADMFLQDVISSTDDVVQAINSSVTHLPSGLDVLPARDIPTDGQRPMDVLASQRMSELLSAAREMYDLVILDTPALAEYVDARALVSMADRLLLVIESDKSSVTRVNEALDPIDRHRNKIEAVIFNKTKAMRTEHTGRRMGSSLLGLWPFHARPRSL